MSRFALSKLGRQRGTRKRRSAQKAAGNTPRTGGVSFPAVGSGLDDWIEHILRYQSDYIEHLQRLNNQPVKFRRKEVTSGSDRGAGAGDRNPGAGGTASGSPFQNAPAYNPNSGGPFASLPVNAVPNPANVVRRVAHMPREIPTTHQPDPVVAWKEAILRYWNGTVELRSRHANQVRLTSRGQRAECTKGDSHQGLIPRVDCSCGWYSFKTLPVDWHGVWIEVEHYGRVIECTLGYRAEYQRVVALLIPKNWCQGGFLCDNEPELLQFNGSDPGFICVCKDHANKKWSAPVSKVERRLQVPVRMVHVDRPD